MHPRISSGLEYSCSCSFLERRTVALCFSSCQSSGPNEKISPLNFSGELDREWSQTLLVRGTGRSRPVAPALGTECHTKPAIVYPSQGARTACPGDRVSAVRTTSEAFPVTGPGECEPPNPRLRTIFTDCTVSCFSGALGVKTSLSVNRQSVNDLNFLEGLHTALTHTHTHMSYLG